MAVRLEAGGELSDARTAEFVGHEKRLYRRLLTALQRQVAA
jgi:hypothetical protein